MKLRLRLQLAPAARVVDEVQSAGVPEPGTWVKLGPTVRPVISSETLPLLPMVSDWGLSALVWPTAVAAKLRVGG